MKSTKLAALALTASALIALSGCAGTDGQSKADACRTIASADKKANSADASSVDGIQEIIDAYSGVKSKVTNKDVKVALNRSISALEKSKEMLNDSTAALEKAKDQLASGGEVDEYVAPTEEEISKMTDDAEALSKACS